MYIGKIDTGRSYKKIIAVFIIISVVLIALVTYSSVTRATITITPVEDTVTANFEIRIEKDPTPDPNFTNRAIPGRVLSSKVEGAKNFSNIPEKEVEEKVTGTVTLYNKRGESQPLLVNTQLKAESNGLIYRTDAPATIPANGKIDVAVTCDGDGPKGETEPTRFIIVKIWEPWQELMYGENSEAFKGGQANKPIVTDEEINAAKDELANELYLKAYEDIKSKLRGDESFRENATKNEILSSKASVKPDTEASDFNMEDEVKVTAAVFDETELENISIGRLKDKIPENKEYKEFFEDRYSYEVTDYNLDKQTTNLKVHIEGISIPKLSLQIFDKNQLIGRSPDEVKSYFESFTDIQSVDIKFSPFWIRSVPALKDHIDIIIEE